MAIYESDYTGAQVDEGIKIARSIFNLNDRPTTIMGLNYDLNNATGDGMYRTTSVANSRSLKHAPDRLKSTTQAVARVIAFNIKNSVSGTQWWGWQILMCADCIFVRSHIGADWRDEWSSIIESCYNIQAIKRIHTIESAATLEAKLSQIYNITGSVDTITITLSMNSEEVNNTVEAYTSFFLTTGSSPNIRFTDSNSKTISYQNGWQLEANTKYKIIAEYNGIQWYISAIKYT